MKQIDGIWFPDNDAHFEKYSQKMDVRLSKYQKVTAQEAFKADKRKTCFVDVGAHVGLWAMQATRAGYQDIRCFEPTPDNYECLLENLKDTKAIVEHAAIGVAGTYKMKNHAAENSGAWECKWSLSRYDKKMIPLDDYNLAPSLIKIDTQGTECDVILGAVDTIRKHKPIIIVEQSNSAAALAVLVSYLKYRISHEIRNDYLLEPM